MYAGEKVLIGKASRQRCDAIKDDLSRHGFEVVTIHNKSTCSSGCSTELEIWAHREDLDKILVLLKDMHEAELKEYGYNPDLLNSVYDPSQSEASCPACSTIFSTKLSECPSCELSFGGPVEKSSGCSTGKC